MKPEINITTEQAEELENYVSDHIAKCHQTLYDEQEIPDFEPFGPFCGCEVCETREYLLATFTFLNKNDIVDIGIVD